MHDYWLRLFQWIFGTDLPRLMIVLVAVIIVAAIWKAAAIINAIRHFLAWKARDKHDGDGGRPRPRKKAPEQPSGDEGSSPGPVDT